MGIEKLNNRFKDPNLQDYFEGLFCKDHPRNTRFCYNFFVSIGLGVLAVDLKQYFENAQKMVQNQQRLLEEEESSDDSSSSSDSSSSGSGSGSGSSSSSENSSDSGSKSADKK